MENVLLFHGVPVILGDYLATYVGDSETINGKDHINYYRVDFEKKDSVTKKVTERFSLYPDAFINSKGQGVLTVNPSTKHYLTHDIFTYINGGTLDKSKDTSSYLSHVVNNIGDTIFLKNGFMVYKGLSKEVQDKRYVRDDSDLAVCAKLMVYDSIAGPLREINPIYVLKNKQYVSYIEDTVKQMNLYTRLENIIVKSADSVSMENEDTADRPQG